MTAIGDFQKAFLSGQVKVTTRKPTLPSSVEEVRKRQSTSTTNIPEQINKQEKQPNNNTEQKLNNFYQDIKNTDVRNKLSEQSNQQKQQVATVSIQQQKATEEKLNNFYQDLKTQKAIMSFTPKKDVYYEGKLYSGGTTYNIYSKPNFEQNKVKTSEVNNLTLGGIETSPEYQKKLAAQATNNLISFINKKVDERNKKIEEINPNLKYTPSEIIYNAGITTTKGLVYNVGDIISEPEKNLEIYAISGGLGKAIGFVEPFVSPIVKGISESSIIGKSIISGTKIGTGIGLTLGFSIPIAEELSKSEDLTKTIALTGKDFALISVGFEEGYIGGLEKGQIAYDKLQAQIAAKKLKAYEDFIYDPKRLPFSVVKDNGRSVLLEENQISFNLQKDISQSTNFFEFSGREVQTNLFGEQISLVNKPKVSPLGLPKEVSENLLKAEAQPSFIKETTFSDSLLVKQEKFGDFIRVYDLRTGGEFSVEAKDFLKLYDESGNALKVFGREQRSFFKPAEIQLKLGDEEASFKIYSSVFPPASIFGDKEFVNEFKDLFKSFLKQPAENVISVSKPVIIGEEFGNVATNNFGVVVPSSFIIKDFFKGKEVNNLRNEVYVEGKVKPIEFEKIGDRIGIVNEITNKSKTLVKELVKSDVLEDTRIITKTIQSTSLGLKSAQVQETGILSVQDIISIQEEKLESRRSLETKGFEFKEVNPEVRKPLLPEIRLPDINFKKRGSLQDDFKILVRIKGKEVIVGEKQSLKEAALLGKKYNLEGSTASFRILKNNKPLNNQELFDVNRLLGNIFRPSKVDKDRFVQKREYRISTSGEKAEITMLGINASKKKKKESLIHSPYKVKIATDLVSKGFKLRDVRKML